MSYSRQALALFAVVAVAGGATTAAAQTVPRMQSEARVDAITGNDWAIHAGLGVTAPLGTYVRFGAVGGLGPGSDGLSGRTDLVARFTLDPFREKRWAPYGVGGVSARFDGSSRTYLVLMAGVAGPSRRGIAPAIEFGFGGSFRAGLALRQAFTRRR